jgi:hypothetical protein
VHARNVASDQQVLAEDWPSGILRQPVLSIVEIEHVWRVAPPIIYEKTPHRARSASRCAQQSRHTVDLFGARGSGVYQTGLTGSVGHRKLRSIHAIHFAPAGQLS